MNGKEAGDYCTVGDALGATTRIHSFIPCYEHEKGWHTFCRAQGFGASPV